MHVLLSSLTAAMLLSQTVFGWCCHYQPASAEKQTGAVTKCCSCDGCSKHETDRLPATPCKVVCRGVCTYLPPSKVQLDTPTAGFFASILPAILSLPNGQRLDAASFADWARGPTDTALPLRLHLLNQILLI